MCLEEMNPGCTLGNKEVLLANLIETEIVFFFGVTSFGPPNHCAGQPVILSCGYQWAQQA